MKTTERYGTEPQLRIHCDDDSAAYEVWINPDGPEFSGLCIGTGDTRQEAVADAVKALEWALATLQETPAPDAKAQPCPRCNGDRVICVAAGGNPDAAEDVPCPRCGEEGEEDPRTVEEIRAAATFAETHGGEL